MRGIPAVHVRTHEIFAESKPLTLPPRRNPLFLVYAAAVREALSVFNPAAATGRFPENRINNKHPRESCIPGKTGFLPPRP